MMKCEFEFRIFHFSPYICVLDRPNVQAWHIPNPNTYLAQTPTLRKGPIIRGSKHNICCAFFNISPPQSTKTIMIATPLVVQSLDHNQVYTIYPIFFYIWYWLEHQSVWSSPSSHMDGCCSTKNIILITHESFVAKSIKIKRSIIWVIW
jgi:hypothetical protein